LCNLHFSILIFLDLILFVSGIEGTDNMPVKQAFALLLLRNFARSLSFTIVRSEGQGKYSGRGVEGMLCSCHAFGMLVPRLWHDCAIAVAQLCQALCTTISEVWHNRFRRWHNRSDSLSQTIWILERETTKGEMLVTV
jgi:hypothetical protein